MKSNKTHNPPRWAERLLEWYCRHSLLEDLQGDLHEFFDRNIETKGLVRARLIFAIDVIKFIRPYTLKKLKPIYTSISISMLFNHIKSTFRNLSKQKLFSFINIAGLAISMAICLLSISFVTELYSFDRFNIKRDRIYRLTTDYQRTGQPTYNLASSSIYAGNKIFKEVPGVEDVSIITYGFGGNFTADQSKFVPLEGHWASASFFNVFSLDLLQGNPETVLKEPHSIVLTEDAAMRAFGSLNVVGRSLSLDGETDYLVTGIMENVPTNSHFQFEVLCSLETNAIEMRSDNRYATWGSVFTNYVYLLLEDGQSPNHLQERLNQISVDENSRATRSQINLGLQPMNEIAVGTPLMNGIGFSIEKKTVWMVIGLTLIIVLSACFNYTNLSIARSIKRSREIGVRKTLGATRIQVFKQFLIEAIIISMISLGFAYLIFETVKGQALSFDEEIQQAISLNTSPQLFAYFVLFTIMVGLMAGAFPALVLSKTNVVQALKGAISKVSSASINMRKVLLVFQYTLSLGFILAATISLSQYKYALDYDLGYETEHIVNVPLQGNDIQTVSNIFSAIPEVQGVSKSWLVLGTGRFVEAYGRFNNPNDSAMVNYNLIDEHYLPLHDYQFLAGNNFPSESANSTENLLIVNETLLKRFGIGSPSQAIDQPFTVEGQKHRIVGVVRDFNSYSLSEAIVPFAFQRDVSIPSLPYQLNLKVVSDNMSETMSRIENAWEQVDTVNPFEAQFYDEQIKASYVSFLSMFKIVSSLAIVAISIATLGLLGMAVYVAESKYKEIGIRKVLGAPARSLVFHLSKGMMMPLLMAILIALPATYFLFDRIVLNEIVYRANIGFMDLLSGVFIVFLIGFLTIGSQVTKTLLSNPSESLRTE